MQLHNLDDSCVIKVTHEYCQLQYKAKWNFNICALLTQLLVVFKIPENNKNSGYPRMTMTSFGPPKTEKAHSAKTTQFIN